MMFSVCLSSFLFIMTSSFSKMPISGTHTVVGALLGAGIYGGGVDNLNWDKLIKIIASWFISPALSSLVAAIIMVSVATFTMNTVKFKFRTRLLSLQFIIGFTVLIIAVNIYFLIGIE